MGLYSDFSDYTVIKCHELNVREAERLWKHVGIWLFANAHKRKAKR